MNTERRANTLTPADIAAIIAAHQESYGIDPDTHRDDHNFVKIARDREARCQDVRRKISVQAIGWGVITFIGGIGYLIAMGVIDWMKRHL